MLILIAESGIVDYFMPFAKGSDDMDEQAGHVYFQHDHLINFINFIFLLYFVTLFVFVMEIIIVYFKFRKLSPRTSLL